MMQLKVLPPSSTETFWAFWFAEATAWWWNDYINWHIPWIFVPLVISFSVSLCIGMMVFMMRGGHGGRSNYALDVLKERFARGEITKAEYEERRRRWKSEHFKVYCAGRASERRAVLWRSRG